jgi:hypothetical protein
MIIGRDNGNPETVRKTISSGRIFSTNMHEICKHVQTLLSHVYSRIYGDSPNDVDFLLVPMPRLEVETIQDFKILHEIGVLSPDMSIKLSRVLLGEEPMTTKRQRQEELKRNRALAGNAAGGSQPASNFEAPPAQPGGGREGASSGARLKALSQK